MNAKVIRIILAAVAGGAGSVAVSGAVSGDVASVLNIGVTLIGTLAPLLLRSKAGK